MKVPPCYRYDVNTLDYADQLAQSPTLIVVSRPGALVLLPDSQSNQV